MTFLECCQTVREHGLRMIRPREHTPGLYDIREPFEAGAGWVWLDATTANVVCQIFDALSPDRQETFKTLPASVILKFCWRVAMAYSLYLIRNTRDTDLYYAEHGEIGGVPDAVGYDEPLHAMKFRTYEEAQAYIDTSSRSGQETAIVRRSLPPRILPGLAVELRLCSAAASRSRTACWRRRPAGFVSGDAKGGKTNESNTEKQDAHPDGGSPGTGGRA